MRLAKDRWLRSLFLATCYDEMITTGQPGDCSGKVRSICAAIGANNKANDNTYQSQR
ncbi:hypothetical protein HMPREF0758_2896 [Serratia odorifera DSM 4582]|uniref:Uncharacterized protein n=1 Tax=Serratia odorifera DSM 4582 TaxID=667129 RepID=D4E3Z6_SEROD|nr:hypothetical protein HMPREF0758_2896 [Serratia odorifera DSM 4582]